MTELSKPVRRGAGRFQVVLMPASKPFILVKEKGTRKWFEISIETVWVRAVKMEVERERAQKERERAERKAAKAAAKALPYTPGVSFMRREA